MTRLHWPPPLSVPPASLGWSQHSCSRSAPNRSYSLGRHQQPLAAGNLCCSLLRERLLLMLLALRSLFGVRGEQSITGSSRAYPEKASNALVESSSDLPSL